MMTYFYTLAHCSFNYAYIYIFLSWFIYLLFSFFFNSCKTFFFLFWIYAIFSFLIHYFLSKFYHSSPTLLGLWITTNNFPSTLFVFWQRPTHCIERQINRRKISRNLITFISPVYMVIARNLSDSFKWPKPPP